MTEIFYIKFPPPKHWEKARRNELTEKHGIYGDDLKTAGERSNGSSAGLIGILKDRISEINWQIENPPKPALKNGSENVGSKPVPKV